MEIAVFDEHHEAFLFWEEALSLGKIRKKATLLHVDSHSDIGVPRVTESVYTKDLVGFVERQLNIGSFIIPAVMRGIFKEVIFLSRGTEYQERKEYYIGSLHGKGTCINNGLAPDKLIRKLYPDLKQWYYTITDDPEAIKIKNAVLDIDLDYFYSYFLQQQQVGLKLTKAQIKKVKKISLSDDKYGVYLPLFDVKGGILRPFGNAKFKEVILNDSKEWIECAIRYFVESLKIKPRIISVCRSVKTGFTPKKHAKFAERTLINYLTGRQKKFIDPCDIDTPFVVYPFIASVDNIIYNPLTNITINLRQDSRFIWKRISKGRNFLEIFEEMKKAYDIEPEPLKREILKFIFRLKSNYFIR